MAKQKTELKVTAMQIPRAIRMGRHDPPPFTDQLVEAFIKHLDNRLDIIEAKIDDLLSPGSKDIIETRYRKEIG